jgi:hypothetical protein
LASILLATACAGCAAGGRECRVPTTRAPGPYPDPERQAVAWGQPRLDTRGPLKCKDVSASIAGDQLALLYTGATVNLQNPSHPLKDKKEVRLRVPVRLVNESRLRPVRAEVRGHVARSRGGRATLAVHVGGGAPERREYAGDDEANEEFFFHFDATPPPTGARWYDAVFNLSARRDSADDWVLITVDSIDMDAGANR